MQYVTQVACVEELKIELKIKALNSAPCYLALGFCIVNGNTIKYFDSLYLMDIQIILCL